MLPALSTALRVDAARIRRRAGLADNLADRSRACLRLGSQKQSGEECAERSGDEVHGERSECSVCIRLLVGEFVRSWKPPESSTFILIRDPNSAP